MKKLYSLMSIIFMLIISSCSSEQEPIAPDLQKPEIEPSGDLDLSLTPEEYMSVVFDTNSEIDEDGAVEVVNSFLSARSRSGYNPSVAKKYYINGNITGFNTQTVSAPVYEVSLSEEKGGYAIVSGDERFPIILAYVENGSLSDTTTNIGASLMINEAKRGLLNKIAKFESVKDSVKNSVVKKYKAHYGITDLKTIKAKILAPDHESRSTKVTPPKTGITINKEPLIFTKWDQDYPYNSQLDNLSADSVLPTSYKGKNAVGCLGTAVSQIVAHFECVNSVYGVALNWEQLKSASKIYEFDLYERKDQVAFLCKYVANGIKTTWKNGVGSASIKNTYSFLNSIGLTFDTGDNYAGYGMNATRILASIDSAHPIFVAGTRTLSRSSGEGGTHVWILDGYMTVTRTTTSRTIVKESDTYIHANFGWGEQEDGYYLVDRNTTNLTFQTAGSGDYSTNLKLYTNIRKK